jgi:DNA polymerase III epsilon subunit-like protein
MIVVDVETTGTNPQKHSLVSIGAVDFNKPDRQFYEECRIWKEAHIDPRALEINGFSREEIVDAAKKTDKEIVQEFLNWIGKEDRMLIGHNPGNDRDFLRYTAERYHLNWDLPYRTIDLHSICYFHMLKHNVKPPEEHHHIDVNSRVVSKYVGIPEEPHPHNGLNGAKWEAEALSRLLYDKPLLDEFKHYKIPWLK